MNQLNEQITGIVLAGGLSTRMGTDKGTMLFRGIPLVVLAANKLSSVFSSVMISANAKAYEQFAYKMIRDEYQNCGPMGGIHAVLKNIETPMAFIMSVDLPLLTVEVIESIVAQRVDDKITLPMHGRKMEPLCALYPQKILPLLERRLRAGQYKMQDFIREAGYHPVFLDESKAFTNLNAPSDFEFL